MVCVLFYSVVYTVQCSYSAEGLWSIFDLDGFSTCHHEVGIMNTSEMRSAVHFTPTLL